MRTAGRRETPAFRCRPHAALLADRSRIQNSLEVSRVERPLKTAAIFNHSVRLGPRVLGRTPSVFRTTGQPRNPRKQSPLSAPHAAASRTISSSVISEGGAGAQIQMARCVLPRRTRWPQGFRAAGKQGVGGPRCVTLKRGDGRAPARVKGPGVFFRICSAAAVRHALLRTLRREKG